MKHKTLLSGFLNAVLIGFISMTVTACGGKKSKIGGKSKPVPETQLPPTAPPSQPQGGDLPAGGITDGPERIGPGTGSTSRPRPSRDRNDRNDDRDRDSDRDEDDSEGSSSVGRGDLPPASDRAKAPPVRDDGPGSYGDDEGLVSSDRPTPRPRSKLTQPWYPPNLEGSPAHYWYSIIPNQLTTALHKELREDPRMGRLTRPTLMTLAIGYFDRLDEDGRPYSYDGVDYGYHSPVDPFLRAVVHQMLQDRCQGARQLCGFRLSKVDPIQAIYTKEGRGGHQISLRVMSGALTALHSVNTGRRAAEQRERSARVEELFLKSFTDSDIVVYVGHARDGGGPDFSPPRLYGSGKIDYSYYRSERPGLKKLLQAIQSPAARAGNLGILACKASQRFMDDVKSANRSMSVLAERDNDFSERLLVGGLFTLERYLRIGTVKNPPTAY